jgi:serine protease Do
MKMNMKTCQYLTGACRSVLGLTGGLLLGGAVLAQAQSANNKVNATDLNVPLDQTPVVRDGPPRGSFATIVDKVAPSVVKIEVTATFQNTEMDGFPGSMRPQVEHGLGSGVIVSQDGYILTNNHVVDGAKEVKVTLTDGREFTAKVIGRDRKTDVAVVKIDADNLPVVPMADSNNLKVGDVVLAVGNPFGVGQTVTQGIVSAKDRGNMGIEDYEDFIQTDAAINPGNSGGALVDIDGRLIGINTAILSHTGGSQGVGFAVPSDLAHNVMESLIASGHVTRGYLGVMIQNVTPALAQQFNLKAASGALIGDVVADGPASQAGFQEGDVVVKFDGRNITDSQQLQLAVAETSPGSKVPVEIMRDGNEKKLEATIKQLPGDNSLAETPTDNDNGTLNGVGVGDLDAQSREQFHIPPTIQGAVVTQVDPNSAAAEAGLKPGDVIETINRHPVKNADDAVQLTTNTNSKKTLVRIWDNGGSHYVVVDESHSEG